MKMTKGSIAGLLAVAAAATLLAALALHADRAARAGVPFAAESEPLPSGKTTAGEVVGQIQKNVGVPWSKDTVDTFKGGGPETPVTGVAVTMMATMDVLERASAERNDCARRQNGVPHRAAVGPQPGLSGSATTTRAAGSGPDQPRMLLATAIRSGRGKRN